MDPGAQSSSGDQQLPVTTTTMTTTSSLAENSRSSLPGPSGLSQDDLSRIAAVVAGVMQPHHSLATATPSQQNPLSSGSACATGSSSSSALVTTNSGKTIY